MKKTTLLTVSIFCSTLSAQSFVSSPPGHLSVEGPMGRNVGDTAHPRNAPPIEPESAAAGASPKIMGLATVEPLRIVRRRRRIIGGKSLCPKQL